MEKPNITFKKGQYAVLDRFCYAEFLSYYYLDTKPLPVANNDCQPEVLDDEGSNTPTSSVSKDNSFDVLKRKNALL